MRKSIKPRGRKCYDCPEEYLCRVAEECKYLSPLSEEFDEDDYIETQRREFYREWFQYQEGIYQ